MSDDTPVTMVDRQQQARLIHTLCTAASKLPQVEARRQILQAIEEETEVLRNTDSLEV